MTTDDKYVPSEAEMREAWRAFTGPNRDHGFDTWIARVEREAARRAINELIADKEHMTALLRAENGGEAEDVLAHFRDTLHPEETPMTTAELHARSRTSTHDN